MKVKLQLIIITFLFIVLAMDATAQSCADDYYIEKYSGNVPFSPGSFVNTAKGNIVITGAAYPNPVNLVYSNGWATKLSSSGIVLWSKKYIPLTYPILALANCVASNNSENFFASGYLEAGDTGSTVGQTNLWGAVIKIDKYGNVINTKAFDKFDPSSQRTTMHIQGKTNEGDPVILGNLYTFGSFISNKYIIRTDTNLNVKWAAFVSTRNEPFEYQWWGGSVLHTRSGSLIIGTSIVKIDTTNLEYKDFGYYVLALDNATGNRLWDKTFIYNEGSVDAPELPSPLVHISELPDGNLVFFSSFTPEVNFANPPYYREAVNFITTSSGNLVKAVGYYNKQPGCQVASVLQTANGFTMLLDDGQNPLIAGIDNDMNILTAQSYPQTVSYQPADFNSTSNGYYIFTSNRYSVGDIKLIKTDINGYIGCLSGSAEMIAEDVTAKFTEKASTLFVNPYKLVLSDVPVYAKDFDVATNFECRKECCTTVTDTADAQNICDRKNYSLPNHDVVSVSGTYYITYKSATGCDSIVYYPVFFDSLPHVSLGSDECLEGRDSIVLNATPGYDYYKWSNSSNTGSALTIKTAGIYSVTVSNVCGSSADSVEVIDRCTFPVNMPSAFTPNNDNLNDVFRYPPQNKYTFKNLVVYNRFGQLIFSSSDAAHGWDGTYKNKPQPFGNYVFILTVETPLKKILKYKGTITLMR